MSITNYDNWKLASGRDNEKIICDCDHCDGEIYHGQEYYLIRNSDRVHEECFSDYAREVFIVGHRIAGE